MYNRGIMTPRGEWLKPPRTLFLVLFLLTLVSVSALGWFGWKLLEQERLVDAQRSRERLEHSADELSTAIRGTLAEAGDRLAQWDNAASVPGIDVLRIEGDSIETAGPGGLLYYPFPSPQPPAPSAPFLEAEQSEHADRNLPVALAAYQQLAASPDASIRAGALVRAAGVERKLGHTANARVLYQRLANSSVSVAGIPSDLLASHALCELGERCAEVRQGLRSGRWHMTRGQFEFYWSDLDRLTRHAEDPPAAAVALADAAARLWEERTRTTSARGQETNWLNGTPYVLLWRGTPEHRAALVARPEAILRNVGNVQGVRYSLTDPDGRVILGEQVPLRSAVRTAADSQLPWTLFVALDQPTAATRWTVQQTYLLLSLIVMMLFLVAGTYFIARAIRRESETMRMQSDFISAVSHEFRTPLTSIRHLSELLTMDRVPSEDRRRLYYSTLLHESSRLERLVEGLLNFGRMEAGARQYHFEETDAASVAHRVVAEFSPQLEQQGRRIVLSGAEAPLHVEADPEAIRVALRNLVDNALKYSPGEPAVWVECGMDDHYVAIRVRDHGPGVSEAERRKIFRRFVRGSAALATNAKGSGVGLAMVRHIVAAHGGEVTVASEPGKGSIFTMLLPEGKTV